MATILIADDNPTIQRIISHTLRRAGHEIITAYDGLEALDILEQHTIELGIFDIAMPEMDGLTLLQTVRKSPEYAALPVVMLTASGQDEDRVQAETLGADGFLTKPTSSREILDLVEQLLAD
ncbi:MAG: response regulator [Anaerolineales bacterium]